MPITQSDKRFLQTLFSLALSIFALGQDGSNIRYVKTSELNEAALDKKVHIDFYNRSFSGLKVDTILMAVTDKSLKFVEHREDNGFNNWFSEQYLQSIDSIGNFRLRLIYSKINQITKDELRVVNYFNLYDSKSEPLFDTPFTSQSSYRRKSIAEVLILSE